MHRNYCPFCNTTKVTKFTDEHFIPQVIGGPNTPTLSICSDCNSRFGSKVDVLLNHYPLLAMCGATCGARTISGHSRVKAKVKLHDGRVISGCFVWELKTPEKNKVGPNFVPDRIQNDGTKWISCDAVGDVTKLPKNVNVLNNDMYNGIAVEVQNGDRDKCIPALIKILTGYVAWDILNNRRINEHLFKSCVFERLRAMINNIDTKPEEFNWIEDSAKHKFPMQVDNYSHCLSYCYFNDTFIGLVCLYGRVAFQLSILPSPYFEGGVLRAKLRREKT